MTRLSALFWAGLVLASGFATYKVKYAVQGVDDELTRVRMEIVADRQDIRVLAAEWAYLNRPGRLAQLNQQFLHLVPVTTAQLQQKIADIPLRPPPSPAPATLVAQAAAPTAPHPAPTPARSAAAVTLAANRAAPPPTLPPARPVPAQPAPAQPAAVPTAIPEARPAASPAVPMQMARAEPIRRPNSLDALVAQIAEAR